MEGYGPEPDPTIIADPDPEGPKTYGSGTLYSRLQRHIRQRSDCAHIVIACKQKKPGVLRFGLESRCERVLPSGSILASSLSDPAF
jgi:hypothetical protein